MMSRLRRRDSEVRVGTTAQAHFVPQSICTLKLLHHRREASNVLVTSAPVKYRSLTSPGAICSI